MKGVIAMCLRDLVKEKFGKDKWAQVLEDAGLSQTAAFMPSDDVDDATVVKLLESVCKVLKITPVQAADAFGEYWVSTFATKIYKAYFIGVDNAKDFLLKMDYVHKVTTQNIPNAKPPRFDYEWKDGRTLHMKYKSSRRLTNIFVGLVKGVGKHFNEQLEVKILSPDLVEIVFPV